MNPNLQATPVLFVGTNNNAHNVSMKSKSCFRCGLSISMESLEAHDDLCKYGNPTPQADQQQQIKIRNRIQQAAQVNTPVIQNQNQGFETIQPQFFKSPSKLFEISDENQVYCTICLKRLSSSAFSLKEKEVHLNTCLLSAMKRMNIEKHESILILQDVMQCFFCNVKWTLVKQAKAKLSHLKTCSKKNPLGFETICKILTSNSNTKQDEFFVLSSFFKQLGLKLKSCLEVSKQGNNSGKCEIATAAEKFSKFKTVTEVVNEAKKIKSSEGSNLLKSRDEVLIVKEVFQDLEDKKSGEEIKFSLPDTWDPNNNEVKIDQEASNIKNPTISNRDVKFIKMKKERKKRTSFEGSDKPKKSRKKKSEVVSMLVPAQEAQILISEKRDHILISSQIDEDQEQPSKLDPVIRCFGETTRAATSSFWEMASRENDIMSQPKFLKPFIPCTTKQGSSNFKPYIPSSRVKPEENFLQSSSSATAQSLIIEDNIVGSSLSDILVEDNHPDSYHNQSLDECSDKIINSNVDFSDGFSCHNYGQQITILSERDTNFTSQRSVYPVANDRVCLHTNSSTQTSKEITGVDVAIQTEKCKLSSFSTESPPYQEIEYLKKQHNADIKLYADAHAAEIENLKKCHAKELAALSSNPVRHIDWNLSVKQQLENLNNEHAEEIKNLKIEWEEQKTAIKSREESFILEIERNHAMSLKEIEMEHRVQLEEMRRLNRLSESELKKVSRNLF